MKTSNKRQSKKQILSNINGNGGFCNLNNWNTKDKAEWVRANFKCSKSLALNVAYEL